VIWDMTMRRKRVGGRRGGRGRYWFITCYYHSRRQDAMETFAIFARAGLPTLLFIHNYEDMWCIATYASDEQLLRIGWKPSTESYAGLVRVRELLENGTLIRAANFGTKEIDEIIDKIMTMKDGA